MFICTECGHVFDTPKVYTETHGLECPPYENFCGCPECSGAFEEAKECDWCGEIITGEYVKEDGNFTYCIECYNKNFKGDKE